MWPAADRYVRSAAGPLGLMGSRPARARADSMTLLPPQTWQRPRCALCHGVSNIHTMRHPSYILIRPIKTFIARIPPYVAVFASSMSSRKLCQAYFLRRCEYGQQ